MRGAVAVFVSVALASAVTLAYGCNPIFGIVSRTAGPTWCEQDSQAGAAYCEDFDYASSAATSTALETPQTLGGGSQVTDASASSPPSSLEVTSTGAKGSGVLLGNLVNFGPMTVPGDDFKPFQCNVDVQPKEIQAAARTANVGIAGVGGETFVGGTNGPVDFLLLSFGPDGGSASLGTSSASSAAITPVGDPCGPFFMGALDKEWVTIQLQMFKLPSVRPDGGQETCRIGAMTGDGGKAKPGYVLRIQYDAFATAVLVPDESFAGQAFFAYGISIPGSSPPVTLHFDNAVCWALDGGLTLP